jgi:hypothetical protein
VYLQVYSSLPETDWYFESTRRIITTGIDKTQHGNRWLVMIISGMLRHFRTKRSISVMISKMVAVFQGRQEVYLLR